MESSQEAAPIELPTGDAAQNIETPIEIPAMNGNAEPAKDAVKAADKAADKSVVPVPAVAPVKDVKVTPVVPSPEAAPSE